MNDYCTHIFIFQYCPPKLSMTNNRALEIAFHNASFVFLPFHRGECPRSGDEGDGTKSGRLFSLPYV